MICLYLLKRRDGMYGINRDTLMFRLMSRAEGMRNPTGCAREGRLMKLVNHIERIETYKNHRMIKVRVIDTYFIAMVLVRDSPKATWVSREHLMRLWGTTWVHIFKHLEKCFITVPQKNIIDCTLIKTEESPQTPR